LVLGALDVSIAFASIDASSEPVNWWKLVGALLFQALAVALLLLFVAHRQPSRAFTPGPLEVFRHWLMPYALFAFGVAFSLSLLFNAVACGEEPFVKSRRGEQICGK
jgi:hypothetical protein